MEKVPSSKVVGKIPVAFEHGKLKLLKENSTALIMTGRQTHGLFAMSSVMSLELHSLSSFITVFWMWLIN